MPINLRCLEPKVENKRWEVVFEIFLVIFSILFTLSISSQHALTLWGMLVVHGRTYSGRPGDDFVLLLLLLTIQIIQFEFGCSSGAAIVFVFWLLQFSSREYKTLQNVKQGPIDGRWNGALKYDGKLRVRIPVKLGAVVQQGIITLSQTFNPIYGSSIEQCNQLKKNRFSWI